MSSDVGGDKTPRDNELRAASLCSIGTARKGDSVGLRGRQLSVSFMATYGLYGHDLLTSPRTFYMFLFLFFNILFLLPEFLELSFPQRRHWLLLMLIDLVEKLEILSPPLPPFLSFFLQLLFLPSLPQTPTPISRPYPISFWCAETNKPKELTDPHSFNSFALEEALFSPFFLFLFRCCGYYVLCRTKGSGCFYLAPANGQTKARVAEGIAEHQTGTLQGEPSFVYHL